MNVRDAFLILSHTATQLCGRWLPPPTANCELQYWDTRVSQHLRHNYPVHLLDSEDWEDLLVEELSRRNPTCPNLTTLLRKRPELVKETSSAASIHLKRMHDDQGNLILLTDENYPQLLKQIAKPPLMLSYLGNLEALMQPKISVIGSRQVSYFGLMETIRLGEILASLNVCAVSGGAIGCDIGVHQGMLASTHDQVYACVVFAGGLASLYPRRHVYVFENILARGGILISERLWWQSSQPHDFPIRNRIVSGLSEALIVMQAGEASGALITAHEALEQGRDVYVLKHPPHDVRAFGSERLLEDGAMGFSSSNDLSNLLGWNASVDAQDNLDVKTCHLSHKLDTVGVERTTNLSEPNQSQLLYTIQAGP